MGQGIMGPPNQYGAGLDFDYSVWSPGTRIDLVNVQWDNNYRDVVRFADKDALNTFIDGKAGSGITIENLTYAKPGEDVYLGIPYNRVNRYNYLRASNPLMPIEGDIQKDFFYFILDVEYITPTTTRLRLQLDVWQTYIYDVEIGNCYVERGHIGIANQNQFRNFGRSYLTNPEGLDYGSDLRVIYKWEDKIMALAGTSTDILVVSTVDLLADPGTPNAPNLVSAKGGLFAGMPSGASVYVFESSTSFRGWLSAMQTKPWVTQGIVSATIIPNPSRYGLEPAYQANTPVELPNHNPVPHTVNHLSNWRDFAKTWIPERYRHLLKFLTSPYCIIELSMLTGNAIAIKPELWNNPDLEIQDIIAITPPNQKVSAFPVNYNAYAADDVYADEDLNFATHLANLPAMSIVNNAAIGYLAANKNAILYQRNSADWSQQRAMGMAQGQYDIATQAMHTAMDMSGIGVNADIANTANNNRTLAAQATVNAISQGISGVGTALTPAGAGGAAIAGLSQAAATGINAGIQTQANDEGLSIRNSQAAQSVVTQNNQSGMVRDTNKGLADWAAKGDYANAIAGINAKVQDANMIQPTISGQMGGDTLNFVNQRGVIRAVLKMIDEASYKMIGEYWLRYGYSIRAFMKPPQDLMVMSKFTYWKVTESYIASANVPEGHKQVIRGIMEKGFTNWRNPNDIGQIDIADNEPLEGISY
jgi:phage tail protein X